MDLFPEECEQDNNYTKNTWKFDLNTAFTDRN